VPPSAREALRRRQGDRAASLARVTLRVEEGGAGRQVIHPAGSTSHPLPTERPGETARVELGRTLPSGRFESIARSRSVSVPRVSPSRVAAQATLRFPTEREQLRRLQAEQVRKARPHRSASAVPAPAGGSDVFRPASRHPGDSIPGGASDAFSPPGGPRRR
jgi:hypothetical protein